MPAHNLTTDGRGAMREVFDYVIVGAAVLFAWSVLLDFVVEII